MPGYLNEFMFRFNRRRSRKREMIFYWMLDLAVAHAPVRYKVLIAPRALLPRRHTTGSTHRAWNTIQRTAQSEEIQVTPVEWIPPKEPL